MTAKERRRYYIAKSSIHGLGVFASRPLRRGTTVGIAPSRFAKKPKKGGPGTLFAIEVDDDLYAVPPRVSGIWRINHSCRPSADILTEGKKVRVVVLRDVERGEELTCDYRPSLHEGRKRCHCGAKGCSGKI